MRRMFLLLTLATFAVITAGCGAYANSVEGDISTPQANGPNPAGLPNANRVPKPGTPNGYPVSISPVTIEEVSLAGAQWIELFNATGFEADIGGWTLVDGQSAHTFPFGFKIAGGDRVLVHIAQSGADTGLEQFAPSFAPLSNFEGSLALVRGGGELMDFVQWGNDSQAFENAAVMVGEWEQGDFVLVPTQLESMNYDGSANDSSAWRADMPSPGN
jgi:hypothetical protein